MAKAAKKAGTLFVLSSLSSTPMESVFPEAASPRWFQLYIYKDRGITGELVRRAEAAGAQALRKLGSWIGLFWSRLSRRPCW